MQRFKYFNCHNLKTKMKFYFSMFVFTSLLFACNKDKKQNLASINGIWVEKSFRLDTLDFEINSLVDNASGYAVIDFKTNTYVDTVLNPVFPVNHNSTYNYYLSKDESMIFMQSSFSSNSGFETYTFSMQLNQQSITMQKFYNRRALPAVIELVRIK
jgi:hypothetical protein